MDRWRAERGRRGLWRGHRRAACPCHGDAGSGRTGATRPSRRSRSRGRPVGRGLGLPRRRRREMPRDRSTRPIGRGPHPAPPTLLDALIPVVALVVLIGMTIALFGTDATAARSRVALFTSGAVAALVASNGHSITRVRDAAIGGHQRRRSAPSSSCSPWARSSARGTWPARSPLSCTSESGCSSGHGSIRRRPSSAGWWG